MSLERILIVDDEPLVQKSLGEFLRRRRYTVSSAGNLTEAQEALSHDSFDLVFLDARLPDGDGHLFLETIVGRGDETLVVIITGHGTVENAVNCMRVGAFDYLLKPFSLSQIDVLLQKADGFRQLINVNRYLNDPGSDQDSILGESASVQRLRQLIGRVAPTDATVLITGENGTGKEMVARELFRRSTRRDHPYITVNCAALSETLIESELFGHERGAFTGASDRRAGRFELANRGSLLLDEISEIPLNLQAKLLRVLQEREFERVGGSKSIKINVRVMATSNRNLLEYVKAGKFREDLYYRLNVFPLEVPSLRDREGDVELLANAFLQRFARKHNRKLKGFTASALADLRSYSWPGNVRELQNTIERAVILAEDARPIAPSVLLLPKIQARTALGEPALRETVPSLEKTTPEIKETPIPLPTGPVIDDLDEDPAEFAENTADGGSTNIIPLSEMEREAIFRALRATENNRTRAAEMLGITARTMRNKIAQYRSEGALPAEFDQGD